MFSVEDIDAWEKLGPRAVYGLVLKELAKENNRVFALSGDLIKSSGLDRMKREMPDRVINVGVAEQNMVGVAAGLASEGFIPFASSFAPFITQRANEQIRMNLGYMELNVKLVGLGSGLSMSFLGNSHFGTEDIAMTISIPNITVISPADTTSIFSLLKMSLEHVGPEYIRLTGAPGSRRVYDSFPIFERGVPFVLSEGTDLGIFATGSMVRVALDVRDLLAKDGLSIGVFDVHTLKPMYLENILKFVKSGIPLITIEEHSIIGGLGSAIGEKLAQFDLSNRLFRVGIPDHYGITSDYKSLLEHHHLTANRVSKKIRNFLS